MLLRRHLTLIVSMFGLVACVDDAGSETSKDESTAFAYSEADELLYRQRFNALRDRTGATGLSRYDPLKEVDSGVDYRPLSVTGTPALASSALEAAGAYAAGMNSTAVFVWHNGELQYARYFGDTKAETLLITRSLSKPLAVVAVGRAIEAGYIESLDEPAANYFHEWRGTEKSAIKIRHLLDMRSGLLPQAPAPSIDDVLNRAYLHPRHDEVIIRDYPLVHTPGTRYEYSNANMELVAPLIERATGVQYEDWVASEVLRPIGAAGGMVWMNRVGGTAHAGCCWLLRAETWLRLGVLLLHDGRVGERRLLPAGFVREMVTPTAANPHAGMGVYVAGTYVERRGPANPEKTVGRVLHGEPYLADDLFLFDGNGNQVVYVIPSANLVVVRLGGRPGPEREWDNAYLPNTVIRGLDASVAADLTPQSR